MKATTKTASTNTVKWFKQPDQNLAMGGVLEQWLRTDDVNGSVTKAPNHDYRAQWVDYVGARRLSEGRMQEANYPTLEQAQARVVEEVNKNPPQFRHARTD